MKYLNTLHTFVKQNHISLTHINEFSHGIDITLQPGLTEKETLDILSKIDISVFEMQQTEFIVNGNTVRIFIVEGEASEKAYYKERVEQLITYLSEAEEVPVDKKLELIALMEKLGTKNIELTELLKK